jgi:peptide/nickel transport system substrate-binding protein
MAGDVSRRLPGPRGGTRGSSMTSLHAPSQQPRLITRRLVLLALVVCLLLVAGLAWGLAGALAADPSASPGGDPVVLRVGWTNDPDNLNPFIGAETSAFEIWMLNYDFLVGYDKDLRPVPDLATSWETSADGKVWTFHLRSGVKWQDGQALTARDVAFTYNYIIDNQMGAFSSLTTFIDKAVAVDDATVEIRCSKPKANILRTWIPVLPEHIWGKVKPSAAGKGYVNRPPIVGSGPFQTVEVKKGDYVKMVANPDFWGPKPAIDEILFVTYQNADSMTEDLLGGTLDAAWGIPSAQFAKIQTTPGLSAIGYNLISWDYLSMNCYVPPAGGASRGNPALRDPAFRRALNYAVDKQRIVDVAWAGRAEPGTTLMTPHTWRDPDYHWQPPADQAYTLDPAKARSLLDAAGYRDTDGDGVREGKDGKPIKLRLWARSESSESQREGSLITDWLRDLGLQIQYQVMDDGVYYDSIWGYQGDTYSPDFDLYIWEWDGYADPGDTLASFTTKQIEYWNEPCWSDARFDALVEQQASELDAAKRAQLIWQAQQEFYEQSPQIVLSYPQKLEAVNTAKWDGWTRMYDGKGAAFYTSYLRDSYLQLKPKAAAAQSSSRLGSGAMTAIIAAAVVIVAGAAALVVRRRRPRREEE